MKTTIKTGIAIISLLVISCTKENITRTSSASTQSTDKALTFTIGQHYGGGIVFYIDSTGQHGLIADTVDLPPSKWWNGVYTTAGVTATRIGLGFKNTKKIILSQGDSGMNYAARRCWHYKGSGYTDWFLPSKDELNELYKQKKVVGGFINNYYWSSSEFSSSTKTKFAWCQNLLYGFQNNSIPKRITLSVRAVRAF